MILCGSPVNRVVSVPSCPLVPGVNPAVAKRTGLRWSLGRYVWLVWMNHRIAYCLFSGQMSWGHSAATKLGSPKIMLSKPQRAHSVRSAISMRVSCPCQQLLSFLCQGWDQGPSLPSPRRPLGLGRGVQMVPKFSHCYKSACFAHIAVLYLAGHVVEDLGRRRTG